MRRSAIVRASEPNGSDGPPDGGVPGGLIDGRYRLIRKIGAGGMGIVYLAEDVMLARRVAVKVLTRGLSLDREATGQLLREARGLAALRNPHVVSVYSFGKHEGSYFFVMEFVDGVDLRSTLEKGLPPPERTLSILEHVCDGLADVHHAGLVHRDVKPENVLVEAATERAVLADFGLVDSAWGRGVYGGTPDYCPREQLLGEPSSPSFDVYAFGVLAFELLTGTLPYGVRTLASTFLETEEPAPLISSRAPSLGALDSVIAQALRRDPCERYGSACAMKDDLTRAIQACRQQRNRRKHIERVLIVEPHAALRETLYRSVSTAFFWNPVELAFVDTVEAAYGTVRSWGPDIVIVGAGIHAFPPAGLVATNQSESPAVLRVRAWPELEPTSGEQSATAFTSTRMSDIVRALRVMGKVDSR